jgi:hypothetical protein
MKSTFAMARFSSPIRARPDQELRAVAGIRVKSPDVRRALDCWMNNIQER